MNFKKIFTHIVSIWDSIVNKFIQINDLFIKSRLEYDYSDLTSMLESKVSRNKLVMTAQNRAGNQNRAGDIEEFKSETIGDIVGISNEVLGNFKKRKKNRKVTTRYKTYLQNHQSYDDTEAVFKNLFGSYKKQWDDSAIHVEAKEICSAQTKNRTEMLMHFRTNNLPVREVYIKSYFERFQAMLVIILILLAEVVVNSWALKEVFSGGASESIPAVLVVSLFNTLLPFAFAQWISSRNNKSVLSDISTPVFYGAVLTIWFYVNAVLAKMKILAELYQINDVDYFPQQIMMESANISGIETLISFSTLQIFIVAIIALGFSYHHGRYWRDSDPIAHRLKVAENKNTYQFKSLCRDAKNKIETLNGNFDIELVYEKRKILRIQRFTYDIYERLLVQQTQFNNFKSRLINKALEQFDYAADIYDIQNDGEQINESFKITARNELKEMLGMSLGSLGASFDLDEQILTKPHAIQENSLTSLKNTYVNLMDDFDQAERRKLDDKEMDFASIQND